MSPEPCQRTNSTFAFSYSPERVAGRKRFNPVLPRISDLSFACKKINWRGNIPASAFSIGRAKSSNVTMVETGFPGSPKKYLGESGLVCRPSEADFFRALLAALRLLSFEARTRPNTTGRPG